MTNNEIYTLNGKSYRYNFDSALVEWVEKASEEMLEDNKEWQKKYGKNLWDIVDGYTVIDCIGLSRENWQDKEARDEYLEGWQFEIEAEAAEAMAWL